MGKILPLLVCAWVLVAYGWGPQASPQEGALRGFFPGSAAREGELERIFRSVPTPERAQEDLRVLTRVPHVAGTPADYETAQYMLHQFGEAALEAKIVEYQVLLPMPKEVKVDLVEPFKRQGPTPESEGGRENDPPDPSVVPAFNAYSPSGDVTAAVVYANYGLPEDYRRLKELGIEVAGKIVLARYGKCFRGVKAYVAEQNDAAGVLIYSDPADDGYRQGDVYPRGPWRPPTAVQRGSILYLTSYAGDPLTPGIGATRDAKRLPLSEASTLPHIPTAPLSYYDASPILENLSGPVAPADWQGALPFTYHVGPGASKVRLKLDMDFRTRPIWDVIARIPGASEPEQVVVLGNHRDAWTYGAADPNSGTAPLLAVARGLGQLLKQGWRPRRSIVLASWDAEEFGLIGSTEWVEEHAEELSRHAVAYLNMDVGVSGPHFAASSVPSLRAMLRETSRDVVDPHSGKPLYAVWLEEGRKFRRETGNPITVATTAPKPEGQEPQVGELGSGSDYTPFLQHLGVPSLDLGFGGSYGVYHARDDDFDWMRNFGDPSFEYSVAAAQVFGTLAMRLADPDILPFDYEAYGMAIQKYLLDLADEIKAQDAGKGIRFPNAAEAAHKFTETARELRQRIDTVSQTGAIDTKRLASLNQALLEVERDFLVPGGLPHRAWFRHAFYAPGVYTGYAAVILPGVREALDRKDWAGAAQQFILVQAAIERGTGRLQEALRTLAGPDTPGAKLTGSPASGRR